VSELLESLVVDPDATSRVALTIHELLENTLKYSSDGEAQLDIALDQALGVRTLEVSMSNRATPERLVELCRRIDALADLTDPMGVYVNMMLESAQRDGSGLGLVRVRVEGEMQLTYSVDGDSITIRAITALQGDV
jgi:hypothetical protein